MALPKLEGLIRLSANTIVGTWNGSNITMPAGDYYWNTAGTLADSFLDELEDQVEATIGGTSTITIDDGSDTSTGKITIAHSVAVAINWTSTAIRDAMGFTGNLASASSHLATNHAKYLWLPNCGRSEVMAPEASRGAIESDYTMAVAPGGTLSVFAYSSRRIDTLNFLTVQGKKTWDALESVGNESLEQFYSDVIAMGLPLRFHKDRSDDATYRTLQPVNGGQFRPEPVVENWTESASSLWAIRYDVREVV